MKRTYKVNLLGCNHSAQRVEEALPQFERMLQVIDVGDQSNPRLTRSENILLLKTALARMEDYQNACLKDRLDCVYKHESSSGDSFGFHSIEDVANLVMDEDYDLEYGANGEGRRRKKS